MHRFLTLVLFLAALFSGSASCSPTAQSASTSAPLPSPRANTSPRQSDIDRDLLLLPSAFLYSSITSLAATFIGDRNISSASRGNWSLVLLSANATGSVSAASLDLTLPWSINKKVGDTGEWILPTTLRVNPLNATEIKEEFGTAFRGLNVSSGEPLAKATNGRRSVAMTLPGQGRLTRVELVGNEIRADVTKTIANVTMDWVEASMSSVVGQYSVSDSSSSTYVLDKNGNLYEIDSTGAVRPDPIRVHSAASPSKGTNASLVPLSSNHLLLTGGFNGTHALDDIWLFEHGRSIWTQIGNVRLSTPRHGHHVAIVVTPENKGKVPISVLVFPGTDNVLINSKIAVDVLEVFPTLDPIVPFPCAHFMFPCRCLRQRIPQVRRLVPTPNYMVLRFLS
ncbi:hypothetical protein BCR44DRAFT_63434 [Catenaria anguillulae PL171]|uniref:Galactose oxidase-like Early set domain-containing protein n=1 Tax=Catenaria anguillulae PL171 TaxID=765915 RepID=A0A1Y2HP37_9FUNG|nr:hypothetical protein BCR44DRAFT_63434 [Catenaria anguillulae PL171]